MRKKKDNKKIYISVFIVVIMVLSTFGFILGFGGQGGEQSFEYNGFEFRTVNNQWLLKVDGMVHEFYFHPSDVIDYD